MKTTRKKYSVRPTGSIRHLASRIFNTPLLILPRKLDAILAALGPRLGIRSELIPVPFPEDETIDETPLEGAKETKEVIDPEKNIAVISVHGTLVKRSSWLDADSSLTSYELIRSEVQEALDDPECAAIVLDFDSGGGEAAGMFDLADFLFSVRGKKPLIGIANDAAYSAAYALASCCDKVLVTSVGGVGSIGCYMLHCDTSKFDSEMGLQYTYIFSGERKVEGNPHEPLSKYAFAEARDEVDRIRQMFVDTVARNRGVDPKTIYDTEARVYSGEKAIPLLADQVGTLEDAINLAASMSKPAESRNVALDAAGDVILSEAQRREGPAFNPPASLDLTDRVALMTAMSSSGWADLKIGKELLAVRKFGTAKLQTKKRREELVLSNAKEPAFSVTGILAPYNSLSLDLGGFQEIYELGCFAECLKANDDFRVLFNHNPDHVLGRRSADTARFWEEPDGLHYEADLPDTQAARDLKVSMERGDIRESSAAFYILAHRWEQRSTGRVRIVEKAKLVEGSPASFAAYQSSTVAASDPEVEEIAADHELEHIEARLQLLSV